MIVTGCRVYATEPEQCNRLQDHETCEGARMEEERRGFPAAVVALKGSMRLAMAFVKSEYKP
jgi:hypothetical protein